MWTTTTGKSMCTRGDISPNSGRSLTVVNLLAVPLVPSFFSGGRNIGRAFASMRVAKRTESLV